MNHGAQRARRYFTQDLPGLDALVFSSLREGLSMAMLEAMAAVPRHLFVPEPLQSQAYDDHPLPIGHGQTISQPYIVALMTELARPLPTDRALEIGTGSGYQAAILADELRRLPRQRRRRQGTLRRQPADSGAELHAARRPRAAHRHRALRRRARRCCGHGHAGLSQPRR